MSGSSTDLAQASTRALFLVIDNKVPPQNLARISQGEIGKSEIVGSFLLRTLHSLQALRRYFRTGMGALSSPAAAGLRNSLEGKPPPRASQPLTGRGWSGSRPRPIGVGCGKCRNETPMPILQYVCRFYTGLHLLLYTWYFLIVFHMPIMAGS